ncbi:MAG: bifunctional riboflavin kinase/FAD synthetase [Endomicrobium sp.]|jgi:riboflavin kinase/FMN adenylyltransferase|nr:bifunctional riboflavin kinase/FAD synthetase [Endomicrobium sp.]
MKNKKSVVTIGTFDGIHKGHRALIDKTLSIAKKKNLKSIIIALEKPLKNAKEVLTTLEEKKEILKILSPDEFIIFPLCAEFLSISAQEFFDSFLIGHYKMQTLICGRDFAFGKDRKGNINWLKKKTKESGINIKIIPPLKIDGKKVSSSAIRSMLKSSQIEKANKLLGRPYTIDGIHFREKGIASKFGFPTINLKTDPSKLMPRGVFISWIVDKNKLFPSITNIGYRPTLYKTKTLSTEVHILGFKGVWKTKKVKIALIKQIRKEKKFSSFKALQEQIKKDIQEAQNYFHKSVKLNFDNNPQNKIALIL